MSFKIQTLRLEVTKEDRMRFDLPHGPMFKDRAFAAQSHLVEQSQNRQPERHDTSGCPFHESCPQVRPNFKAENTIRSATHEVNVQSHTSTSQIHRSSYSACPGDREEFHQEAK